jgi:hypothetical protein
MWQYSRYAVQEMWELRMVDQRENMTELRRQPIRKEWRRPGLRRLPIAATAMGNKAIVRGDDGIGGGKGDVSSLHS